MTIRDISVAFGFDVDKNSEKQVESSIDGLKNFAKKALGTIAVVFSVSQISGFLRDCRLVASNVQEMQNKFDVVFQGMTKEVENWAKTFSDSVGRNRNTIKGYLADNQNMFVGMGMTREQAAGLSKDLVTLGLDLASFNNLDEAQAVNALSKALMGESESAKTLGAVLNDNTLAMAMNELGIKGKFQALSEATKMEVRYKAILMQSTDAIGDCVRSIDSYEARQRQLTAAKQAFMEFVGGQLLPVFAIFISWLTVGVKWLTGFAEKLLVTADGQNRLLILFERIHALVKRLQPAFDRFAQTLKNGISNGISVVKTISERLGGMGNVFKIISLAAAGFFIVMKWGKIISLAKGFMSVLSGIGKIFSLAGLKIMIVVAIIVLLALAVEDFVNFLMGNDSLIGSIFDEMGIGADNARKAVIEAWEKIKGFLLEVWDFIKSAAEMFIATIGDFFKRHSDDIRANFERAWGIIKTFLDGVWTFISQLATTLFGKTEESIDGSTNSTKDTLLSVWEAILEALSAVWDAMYEVSSAVFNAVASVIEVVFGWIKTFWENWGSRILAHFKIIWNSLGGILNGFLKVIKGVANFIASVFKGDWEGAWDAIKQIFTGIWEIIVNYIAGVWDSIKLLFEMSLAAIQAVWEAIWNGISRFFIGIWEGLVSFVSGAINGILNTITSVLTAISDFFSNIFGGIFDFVTDIFGNILTGITDTVGNIKDAIVDGFTAAIDWIKELPGQAVEWGADMINGIVDGIKGAIGAVTDAVKGVAETITSFLHFSVPDEGPLTEYESWMPDFMEGLGQGISKSKNKLIDKVKGVASDISLIMQGATAKPNTAAAGMINSTSRSMTQNVNINNSYSGGTREVQRAVSSTMNKSAVDATTLMARGLSYARG